jgi:cell wall-associated NlpC family hydrolase
MEDQVEAPYDELESAFAELKSSSRVSLAMIVVAAVVLIGTVVYSATRLSPLERELKEKTTKIGQLRLEVAAEISQKDRLSTEAKSLKDELSILGNELGSLRTSVEKLTNQVNELKATQGDLFEFLSQVTEKNQLSLIDSAVDWKATQNELMNLPRGKRKQALLTAILLAWKEIPFSMGQQSVNRGFDSPRFIRYVLQKNGVTIPDRPNERLSDTLMKSCRKVDKPWPGDLIFYRGAVGSFGLMCLSADDQGGGSGIGTLETSAPLQVISLKNVNTGAFPLIGYFRVKYPDEKEG